jgi:hypothetical protein
MQNVEQWIRRRAEHSKRGAFQSKRQNDMRRLLFIGVFFTLSVVTNAQALDPLCQKGETTVFAFKIAKSPKWASLCKNEAGGNDYLVYRFGTPSNVELTFPHNRNKSWKQFEYTYYFRGGGAKNYGLDLNYLSFMNGEWKYTLYQEYEAETDKTSVGVRLEDMKTHKEIDLPGDVSKVQGTLIELRTNTMVRHAEMRF